ncbi:MAG: galactokinase, partial [Clostridia bacterium]|nr:galactokinase [Clostridia bacterium]
MNVRALFDQNQERIHALYANEDVFPRYEALAQEFKDRFQTDPICFVSAPGRTEVVGNHTDHNKGRVLAASVNLDTLAAVASTDNSTVTLYSEGYDEPFIVDLDALDLQDSEIGTTFALIRGVAARMKALGYVIGGFNACVTSTVFKGSGLSSSAAFEVMLVAIFDALYNGWSIDAKSNALISQYAENVYFGKPSGLLDQSASAQGGLVTIDFGPQDPPVEAMQYDFAQKGFAVCVVSAG